MDRATYDTRQQQLIAVVDEAYEDLVAGKISNKQFHATMDRTETAVRTTNTASNKLRTEFFI